jgi:CRISPR-associated protein Cas1
MILVIDRRDSTLRQDHGVLRLESPGQPVRRAPIAQLELVVVYGNAMAETAVWRALANAGVPAVMLPARGRDGPAILANGLATQLPIRRLQHRHASDAGTSLALVRWMIRHKLMGYDLPLTALSKRHELENAARAAFLARRDRALTTLEDTTDYDTLIGIEGQVAHAWFGLIADTLNPAWGFTGRNRRPPRDPLNALLSLGYTLVGAEVHQGIVSTGLDPSLGFLHQPVPGRESMVLDLTEIFRSGVDYFALNWIHPDGPDQRHWYYREQEGCRLAKEARPAFYGAWAMCRTQWPYPIHQGDGDEWPDGDLRGQINGWIERLRDEMKRLVVDPEDTDP